MDKKIMLAKPDILEKTPFEPIAAALCVHHSQIHLKGHRSHETSRRERKSGGYRRQDPSREKRRRDKSSSRMYPRNYSKGPSYRRKAYIVEVAESRGSASSGSQSISESDSSTSSNSDDPRHAYVSHVFPQESSSSDEGASAGSAGVYHPYDADHDFVDDELEAAQLEAVDNFAVAYVATSKDDRADVLDEYPTTAPIVAKPKP